MKVAVCGITPSSVHFRTYVNFLLERGHEVTVLTNAYEIPSAAEGSLRVVNFARHTRLIKVVPPGLRLLPRVSRLRTGLRAEQYDVLDVMQVTPDGVYAAMLWDGPLVLDFWGSDIMRLEIRPWWVRSLMPKAIAKADAIHSVSNQMTDRLEALGADPSKIETFQYGIDLDHFTFAPPPHKPGRIVHTRGLRPLYRSEIIIRAMPRVLAVRPDAVLALTGSGEERTGLESLAADLGIADKVEFLGFVTDERLAEELRAASVWVSIPPSDGTPLSLLEAMSAGALPVASDLPTVRDWIAPEHGVLVGEITPEAVAVGLLHGLELAAQRAFAEPNRHIVEERGDRAVNLPRWEQILQRTAGAPAG